MRLGRIAASATICAAVALALFACARSQPPNPEAEYGPAPKLAQPQHRLLPVVNPAQAGAWPDDGAPIAPHGFKVTRFAGGLTHPRWINVLPNGDVLVAESSTRRSTGGGVVSWITNGVMRKAGAFGPEVNEITLLRDEDGDGVVDLRNVFAHDLNQPFGMALVGDKFFVANTDGLIQYKYGLDARRIIDEGERVLDLPFRDGDNGHWTRSLLATADGRTLYIAVGSSSNIADHGMDDEKERAAIWSYDVESGEHKLYATGLRNPVGMDFEPESGALWVVVNERDMLGDALAPDYLTRVQEGAFYGWPYSYYGQHVDERVKPQNPAEVARAIAPDFALGAHVAPLGLAFYRAQNFPASYRGGAFIGEHGSWNRTEHVGYKVVFVPFAHGAPSGPPEDFLSGFLNADDVAQGRPVGIAVDHSGALLVVDDVGGIVWRVVYEPSP